jgi:hypothetical protein
MTTKEIRINNPIASQESNRTSSEITRCLTESEIFQRYNDGRVKLITFPDGKGVEISLGAIQRGEFRTYYLVTIMGSNGKSLVQIRRSESNFFPINAKDFEHIVRSCLI